MSNYTLTPEKLAELKANNPGIPLFKKTLFNNDYVFTIITKEDQQRIDDFIKRNPKLPPNQVDEKYVDYGLKFPMLTPVEQVTLAAGVYPTLARLVKEKSLLELPNNVADVTDLYSVEVLVDAKEEEKPDEETITSLKASSQHALHRVDILGRVYIVRPLVRSEWTKMQQSSGDIDLDAAIAERCTMWPKKVSFDDAPGGIPLVLARHILMFSGFQDSGEVTEL